MRKNGIQLCTLLLNITNVKAKIKYIYKVQKFDPDTKNTITVKPLNG